MFFGIIILIRVLFIACMVFLIGYVFGNFSTKPALRTITKIASILVIVLFIASNILSSRFATWDHHAFTGHANHGWCIKDSTVHKQSLIKARRKQCSNFCMKASTERKIMRWMHIILSIPIVGFIYGPVASLPNAAFAVRWIFFPIVVISGFWMWKAQQLKRWLKRKQPAK